MLRQLQLRAPIKGLQLKRSLTYNPKQLQPFALGEAVKKEPQIKMQSKPGRYVAQLIVKIAPIKAQNSNNLPLGYSNLRKELPIYENLHNIRQYSVCLNPLDQLQTDQGKLSRSNNLTMGYSDMGVDQANSVALVPLEHSSVEQNMKNVVTPKPQPQPKVPEQPVRKIPYYNPLRRRSNVDPARVQYIKDRFKERSMETDTNKPQGKKFVSRTTLHSGRLDKID
ncbi:uncharacterized protein [Drosophila virilis]|uniref:Uncharacterized protein n=1 Tax=Drosophila virilis TaxID=7244 RepID=B4M3P8_DROVI|nr:uncharacterized protein LOC6631959 [Drosophila virilis]EDW65423.1 uncharacterized protein Dvir_GJ18914 [Drosophila virilis]